MHSGQDDVLEVGGQRKAGCGIDQFPNLGLTLQQRAICNDDLVRRLLLGRWLHGNDGANGRINGYSPIANLPNNLNDEMIANATSQQLQAWAPFPVEFFVQDNNTNTLTHYDVDESGRMHPHVVREIGQLFLGNGFQFFPSQGGSAPSIAEYNTVQLLFDNYAANNGPTRSASILLQGEEEQQHYVVLSERNVNLYLLDTVDHAAAGVPGWISGRPLGADPTAPHGSYFPVD